MDSVVSASLRRMQCRNCEADLSITFVDLGVSPLSNSYVTLERTHDAERFYPLHAYVCSRCLLVQLDSFESRENIFSDYAYFSSYSDSWLTHSRDFADEASDKLRLPADALVVEAASNDGYLLQFFAERGLTVLGVEPAANVAAVAVQGGIRTEVCFLGVRTATELRGRYGPAQLVVANNVIGHVPDLHDFVGGLRQLLAPGGTISVEIPHLQNLILLGQFDTIYHEHFSYFSLHTMSDVLRRHSLRIWDVQEVPTHGGSLRYWIVSDHDSRTERESVAVIRDREVKMGITQLATYEQFGARVARMKREILRFFLDAVDGGAVIAGYGAPAKGNTMLNYCGIGRELLPFTVDRNPAKQGTLLPGSRIPVLEPGEIRRVEPDYVFILPWNIRDEVVSQMSFIRQWGGKFVTAFPHVEIF